MEDFKKVEDLVDHVKEYVHVRVDEARLNVAERSSTVIASIIAGTAVAAMFMLSFLLICVAGALLLGRVLDDLVLGFLIMAGFCVVAGLIIRGARNRLIRIPIMNAILRQLFQNDDTDEED